MYGLVSLAFLHSACDENKSQLDKLWIVPHRRRLSQAKPLLSNAFTIWGNSDPEVSVVKCYG